MSKYTIDYDAEPGPGNCLVWTKVQDPEDFIEEKILTDDSDQKIIKAMKALAARLSSVIEFHYMTLDWSAGIKAPVVKLWNFRPVWHKETDEYGEEHIGWIGETEVDWHGWGMLDTQMLRHESVLNELPQNTNFSKFFIKRVYNIG